MLISAHPKADVNTKDRSPQMSKRRRTRRSRSSHSAGNETCGEMFEYALRPTER